MEEDKAEILRASNDPEVIRDLIVKGE